MRIAELFKKVDTYNEIAAMMYTKRASVILHDHTDNTVLKFYNVSQFRHYIKAYHDAEMAKQIMSFEGWDWNTAFDFDGGVSETFRYSVRIVSRDADVKTLAI